MRLRTSRWTWLRIVEACLFAGLLALVAGCTDCGPDTDHLVWFKFKGKLWRLWYEKGNNSIEPLSVVTEDGKTVKVNDPRLPFTFLPKDGGVEILPRSSGGAAPRSRAAALPSYVWLLSTDAADLLYVMNAETGLLVSKINLPVRPIGFALQNDGTRAYVTHQEVEAGNPFFPASPPRISVIDKSSLTIVGTINLPTGKNPGKPVLSPDDRLLYVPNSGTFVSPTGYQNASVIIIDTQTRAIVGEIPLNTPGSGLSNLAITPDGALLYGLQFQSSPMRVFVIDTFLREVAQTFIVSGGSATDILMNYTGTRLFILTSNSVIAYDTATNTEARRQLIRQNGRLNSLALSLDGYSLFVNEELLSTVYRLRAEDLSIAETIDTRPGAGNPDSSRIFAVP